MNNIISPIITEKAMAEAAKGKFTFAVNKAATKDNIKKEIGAAFNVTVIGVQTIIAKGKRKKIGKKRTEVKDSAWKRAVVTLKNGEKIDMFEAAGTSAEK
jgi:large subunit ribosomal protein L23